MKILWLSVAPWFPTGYGQQTAIWARRLKKDGYDVELIASLGLQGGPFEWEGIPVWPSEDFFDVATLYENRKADFLIALRDVWTINPEVLAPLNAAYWTPIDATPMGFADRLILQQSGAIPIAMSRHGRQMLREAGFQPVYIPHGVDTHVFEPFPDQRAKAKQAAGIPEEAFVIGINAANKDSYRKGYSEQLQAFAQFHKSVPNSVLLIHALEQDEGMNLGMLIHSLGLGEAIGFSDQFRLRNGLIGQGTLNDWYNTIDLLSSCSWGEGFGLPIIEAQACGTPVVVTNASSMPELKGPGWAVEGELVWNPTHNAWWTRPQVENIAAAYKQAYLAWKGEHATKKWRDLQADSRQNALRFNIEHVYQRYWKPFLSAMEEQA